MKKNFLGFIILLLLVFVGAILLLDFTDNAPEALLKKTVYTLYSMRSLRTLWPADM